MSMSGHACVRKEVTVLRTQTTRPKTLSQTQCANIPAPHLLVKVLWSSFSSLTSAAVEPSASSLERSKLHHVVNRGRRKQCQTRQNMRHQFQPTSQVSPHSECDSVPAPTPTPPNGHSHPSPPTSSKREPSANQMSQTVSSCGGSVLYAFPISKSGRPCCETIEWSERRCIGVCVGVGAGISTTTRLALGHETAIVVLSLELSMHFIDGVPGPVNCLALLLFKAQAWQGPELARIVLPELVAMHRS
ncbi:hypothetical protein EK21DRAFT_85575 [Setomelanomma holmii]|uniref:Uncharacterized protein n=1 Tax=Setomelanomma holmii TaxID=210430 RepID=A0A9P4LRV5_9PLEO|nr:hypothetical protein EK21DRAFT_85575 [Setomelanomma holmii]